MLEGEGMSGGCRWGVSIEVGENVIGRLDVGGLSVWVTRKDDRGGGFWEGCSGECPGGVRKGVQEDVP